MKILLSIKPEFANKIFNGNKEYEFRRVIFKCNVTKVIVYASSPVKKIIGEFEIEKIISHNIKTLWDETKESSGIKKEYFFKYFRGKAIGYAIKIKSFREYKNPLSPEKTFGLKPPQSFAYIK